MVFLDEALGSLVEPDLGIAKEERDRGELLGKANYDYSYINLLSFFDSTTTLTIKLRFSSYIYFWVSSAGTTAVGRDFNLKAKPMLKYTQ